MDTAKNKLQRLGAEADERSLASALDLDPDLDPDLVARCMRGATQPDAARRSPTQSARCTPRCQEAGLTAGRVVLAAEGGRRRY